MNPRLAGGTDTLLWIRMERSGGRDKKRIAIIGAGSSGLAAIKCCLDEGLVPWCLERSCDLGGLWRFSSLEPGIYSSLVINTSKLMMMFSDFPPPAHFPPFLTHAKVLEYFRLYAQHFQLTAHIQFETQVCRVTKSKDYDSTGRWDVTFQRLVTTADSRGLPPGEVCETFDGVMVCTGHHSLPHVPDIPGLTSFQGTLLHSHSYKEAAAFRGKRVVILGFGNSAVDIACDLAKCTEQVYVSSRRGAWIVPRTAFWGLPADMLANSRLVFTLPYRLLDWCVQLHANLRIDHAAYGIKPGHGVLNCHPTINDELPVHLVSGRVLTRGTIVRVDTNSVQFDDHTVCPCDVIILATGYEYRLDVLDEAVLRVADNRTRLYKYVFPPDLPHPSLAVIGLVQSIGASMPISEIQSRWFARIMTGALKLPARQEMLEDIRALEAAMSHLYVRTRRHTLQTFWIDYMDQVATQIQARPCLWKLLCSDPELAFKCYLGPCLPAQYRLVGPGSWSGARQFILSALSGVRKFKLEGPPCAGSAGSHSGQNTGAPVCRAWESTVCSCHHTQVPGPVSSCHHTQVPGPVSSCHHTQVPGPVSSCHHTQVPGPVSSCHHTQVPGPVSSCHHTQVPGRCLTAQESSSADHRRRQTSHGAPGSRDSSLWTTFAFYVVAMAICCVAWLLSVVWIQAESLLNVVDKQLPLVD